MPRTVLRIGTRSSALALAQAEWVRKAIQGVLTRRTFELVPMRTEGDATDAPIDKAGMKGVFVNEIQLAIASGNKDDAKAAFIAAQPEMVRGAQKGVLHKNTVARKLSRLNARIAAL